MNNIVNLHTMTFQVSTELRDKIKYYANDYDMSASAFIRTAIQAYCNALDKKRFVPVEKEIEV